MKYFALLVACFSVLAAESQALEVVPYAALDQQMAKELFQARTGDTIVLVSDGELIPIEFFLDGDLFALEGQSKLQLRVLKTFFVRPHCHQLKFSLDGETWCGFADFCMGVLTATVQPEKKSDDITLEIHSDIYLRNP